MNDAHFEVARAQMIRKQLRRRGLHDRLVLDAMGRIPRQRFVLPAARADAYADRALPIECDQTISQPYIVGLMTQALELSGDEGGREIGTGSGYQTAGLAESCREVVSIERHAELSQQAGKVLSELGYENVALLVGDGTLGCPNRAPFQRIIVTAAAAAYPSALFEQLAEGGLMVIPVGGRNCQTLQAIRKEAGRPHPHPLSACRFVPLRGAQGWPE